MSYITQPKHSGLYNTIRKNYGIHVLRSLRYCVKSIRKTARTDQHLIFNQQCQRYRVIPKCLRTPLPVRTAEGFRIAQRTAFQYLSARISELHKRQKRQLQHELINTS